MIYTKEDLEKLRPFLNRRFAEITQGKLEFFDITDKNISALLRQEFEATVMDAIIYLTSGEEAYTELTKQSLKPIKLAKIGNL